MEKPSKWKSFFEQTKEKPPRGSLVAAIDKVRARDAALDLGAGAMRDTKFLLAQGFKRVTAVDAEESVAEYAVTLDDARLTVVFSKFESFDFPKDTYDRINAQYSLAFTAPSEFDRVFINAKTSLRKGGIFVGQFFGPRESWTSNKNLTFRSRTEVEEMLNDMQILSLQEEEKDDVIEGVPKHWHLFHVTARK